MSWGRWVARELEMTRNKIGPLTLTGLTVGPILGSGILILPPIVYGLIKEWAIIAWLVILAIIGVRSAAATKSRTPRRRSR